MVDRLEKLKELEARLYESMRYCDSKTLPSLARQYRETIREIEEIEGAKDNDDDIASVLAEIASDGKTRTVR